MPLKKGKEKIGRKLPTNNQNTLQNKVFDPLANLTDLEIKKGVRVPLQRAMINYLSLNKEQINLFNELISKAEKEIKDLQRQLIASNEKQGYTTTKIDLKKVELDYLVKNFGIEGKDKTLSFKNAKGRDITLDQLKKLVNVASGLEPGTFDNITSIGRVIGIDPNQWDKGHEAASVLSLKLAGLLRSPALRDDSLKKEYIRKLLDISRRIDHIDQTTLAPFLEKPPNENTAYELISSILNSDLSALDVEADVAKEIVEDLTSGFASSKLTVKFEAKKINNLKSIAARSLGNILKQVLSGKELTSKSKDILNKVDASTMSGSPTLVQVVENIINGLITDKYRKLRKPKKHKLGTIKSEVKKPRIKRGKVKELNYRELLNKVNKFVTYESGDFGDLFRVQGLINEMLAINIEKQMGKPSDPPVKLRYQTGRFADSAKLLTLTRTQAGILAGTYTYQRNPYDTFLPSGRLGTAQRDPRLYVEGAVREAAISILKDKFPGIVLELK